MMARRPVNTSIHREMFRREVWKLGNVPSGRASQLNVHFMAIQIERRFLVRGSCRYIEVGAASQIYVVQGYFARVDQLRVRIRIAWDETSGLARF